MPVEDSAPQRPSCIATVRDCQCGYLMALFGPPICISYWLLDDCQSRQNLIQTSAEWGYTHLTAEVVGELTMEEYVDTGKISYGDR